MKVTSHHRRAVRCGRGNGHADFFGARARPPRWWAPCSCSIGLPRRDRGRGG
ncbi:hypothetical protein HBB16_09650 [Pseudonocardia sp. MCCB 268]|nr:hypothetical protein [Pseudonocardia cytotoxica]